MEFAETFFSEQDVVQLIAIDGVPIKNSLETNLNIDAENPAKYKTPPKSKKTTKNNSDSDDDVNSYKPKFVKMVLDPE